MNESPKKPKKFGFQLLQWVLGGVLAGSVCSLIAPKSYVAEASVVFPSINANTLKQVTKTMQLDASKIDWARSQSIGNAEVVKTAALIMKSRGAVTTSLTEAKVSLPPTLLSLRTDPIETFRADNLEVTVDEGNSLQIKVSYGKAEAARAVCQGILNYYTNFVHGHRLTNTARTRAQLEEKLIRVDRRLTALEHKLVEASSSFRLNSDVKSNPKVQREIWRQRLLEGGSSGRLLDEMRKIRKQANSPDTAPVEEEAIGDDWKSRWGPTTLEDTGSRESSLPRNARRSDLPSRLELERVYEETLLLYHSGLLQYDFLGVWESLENSDFEIVDPVTVSPQSPWQRIPKWAGCGALLGALLAFLFRK